MDIATLPIMLFDEGKLTPSFGYVFDRKWLDPYESIVSILWKLAWMNRLPGQMITMQLARTSIDPYEGLPASQSAVDMRRLHRAIRLPLGVVRGALFPDEMQSASSPYFRYCRKCLYRSYHSILHQIASVERCPVHGDLLETACRDCGARARYRLNVSLLDAPYRCGSCGHRYSSSNQSLVNRRPFSKKARTAITRLRWSYFSSF